MTLIVKPPGSGPNREAIRLYREILRTAKFFTWNDETGRVWSERLKESARKEFEEARYERDPILIARMLVVGRDALMKAQEKVAEAHKSMEDNIAKTRTDYRKNE